MARRDGDPAALVAAIDKIHANLGWRPQHDNLDQIISQALNWEEYLTQNPGAD